MALTKQQIKQFKSQAHHLNPTVIIGKNGLTEAVIKETDIALEAHELIKIKDYASERDQRHSIATEVCHATQAELVCIIGKTIILYRDNPNKAKPS